MKNYIRITLIMTLLMLAFAMQYTVLSYADHDVVSRPVDKNINVTEIIQNTLTDGIIEGDRSLVDRRYSPDDYIVDRGHYVIEYGVLTTYWEDVRSLDYNGLTERLSDYPTIYIPIKADIVNAQSEPAERVIGHYCLSYNYLDQKYTAKFTLMNTVSDEFIAGETQHFYESISNFVRDNAPRAEQVIILRYPNSLNDFMEKAALVFEDGKVTVFDFSNSLHLENAQSGESGFGVEEYRTLRMRVEETAYDNVTAVGNIVGGGSVNTNQAGKSSDVSIKRVVVIAAVIVLSASCIIAVMLLYLRRRSGKLKAEKEEG